MLAAQGAFARTRTVQETRGTSDPCAHPSWPRTRAIKKPAVDHLDGRQPLFALSCPAAASDRDVVSRGRRNTAAVADGVGQRFRSHNASSCCPRTPPGVRRDTWYIGTSPVRRRDDARRSQPLALAGEPDAAGVEGGP